MTKRLPISAPQNAFYDSEAIGSSNLTLEQNYENSINSSIISNSFGNGVLPGNLLQNIIFDSSLVVGYLDGLAVQAQKQPSDTSLGCQLQITLSNSLVAGQKTVKVAIIGLDFNGNLQYDTFVFRTNESQWTQKHYTNILVILFNDLIGSPTQSFNLGGKVIISEAKPFTISRDPIMSSQDIQPNLFFRDFFVAGTGTLQTLLLNALPLYNLDALNIKTGILENQIITAGDVTTQIGEKFLATTNNIQKVTLLLAVQNSAPNQASNLVWAGDLVISIYALQSTVNCITDIIPNLPIEFSPYNIPLAQISYNYNTLQSRGITLDGTPQPIDFIFSNTPIATGSTITSNNFYLVTVKRSGAASTCDILIGTGSNNSPNSRVTIFTGNNWVDLPTLDLWYQIWTDAVQVSDGQAYESGQGLIIPKTQIDPNTNITQDYSLNSIVFSGTSNAIYTGVLSSTIQQSNIQQNQITGNNVFTEQQYVPNIELLNVIDLANLEHTSEPFILGTVSDKNIKSTINTAITADLYAWTFIGNTVFIKMIDDTTDPRYDLNVLGLVSYLENGAFVNAQFIPDGYANDSSYPNGLLTYQIASAELCTMIYGDVNGDGLITIEDVALANQFVGANLISSPLLNSQITTDGYHTTVINGYNSYISPFISVLSGLQWQVVNPTNNVVIASGNNGILLANPNNFALATFESSSVLFNTISNLVEYNLIIFNNNNQANNGAFQILSVDATSNNIIDISKLYLNDNIVEQIMRADILNTFQITAEDGYLIENYINKVPPFPTSILPQSRIGTPFNVLKLTVDPFIWNDPDDAHPTIPNRTDDYSALTPNRATTLHATQDIFINDGYFGAHLQNHNFLTGKIPISIVPLFTWNDYLLLTNGNGRYVPTIFTSQSGLTVPSCSINGVSCTSYQDPPVFDPGLIDVFVPNDLIIGAGGEIVNPDGSNYKVDFEVGTVILEMPDGFAGTEATIDIFNSFVADYTGTGVTRLGFPAMRFADCSTVGTQALINNQVSFNVALQSFSPNLDGMDVDGYTGDIIDPRIGVYMEYQTGQLTLDFSNLFQDAVLRTRNTKVQVTVYLKKGGFNNQHLWVNSTKVANMLNLNNLFSGSGVNNAPFVTLPPINAAIEAYTPTTPSNWNGAPPLTTQQALDRIVALLDIIGSPSKP